MSTHGSFSSDPQTPWLTEDTISDRKMQMLADFSFIDPAGVVWLTPKGYVVDGASIPRALWTLLGSPYTGDYRRASIVHDKACDDASGSTTARCKPIGCFTMLAAPVAPPFRKPRYFILA